MKNRTRSFNSKQSRRSGQGIVEFALITPVLLVILFGILEFGWLIKNTLTITNATREGARVAALGKVTSEVRTRVQNSVQPLQVVAPTGLVVMKYSLNDGTDNFPYLITDSETQNSAPVGSFLKVTVRTRHKPLTGFFPFLNARDITSTVTMRREAV